MTALLHSLRAGLRRRAARLPAPDRVVLAVAGVLAAVALADPGQGVESARFTALSLAGIAPFLLLATALAASVRASGADRLVAHAFTGSTAGAVVAASLFGALSPLCSCGVVPLIAGLLRAGVPLPPVMAFWIASPVMDPEMFVLTAAGIGSGFAVAKTLVTIAMGLLAGFATLGLQRLGLLHAPLGARAGCGGCAPDIVPGSSAHVHWRFWRERARRDLFAAELGSTAWFLGKWLTLAFVLESLMLAWVPAEWIAGVLGGGTAAAIPLAAIVGAPTYLNGYAAIPLVSGLIEMGMAPGAAMAFVTAGAVSSVPAAIAVFALVRRPVFAAYLGLGLAGSIVTAAVYQALGAPV